MSFLITFTVMSLNSSTSDVCSLETIVNMGLIIDLTYYSNVLKVARIMAVVVLVE